MEFSSVDGNGGDGKAWHDRSVISALRAYWEAMREGDEIPHRAALSPRSIPDILENVFMVERVGFGAARFRIAGMTFSDLMGLDLRGMPFSAIFAPNARGQLQTGLETLFTMPAIVNLELTGEQRLLPSQEIIARIEIMPVLAPDGQPHMAIGAAEFRHAPQLIARRFDISKLRFSRLSAKDSAQEKSQSSAKEYLRALSFPKDGSERVTSIRRAVAPSLRIVKS